MNALITFSAAVLLAACSTSGMMIDGEQMSIDAAIMKAGSNGSMSKMMELMQGKDEMGREMVMVEMDILYPMETYNKMREEMTMESNADQAGGSRKKRKAISGSTYRWPNRRVPYEISSTFTSSERSLIMSAISDYHRYTCIRFAPYTSRDFNRVVFQNGGGCSSYVGTIGGRQPISLAPGCRYKGIIIHEMGHAIGFQHEQTRPDRDGYVYINSQNIQSGVAYNFMRYASSQVNNYQVPYDYTSVMHYSQYAFSANGRPTITARDSRFQNSMGNREGLSFLDIQLANTMYSCASANNCAARTCPTGGFQGQDCRCYCDSGSRSNPLKVCDGQAVTTPGPTQPTTTRPAMCEDNNQYCPRWASSGYCTGQYQTYMMSNCKYSCNYCQMTTTTTTTMATPPIANCQDDNQYCSYWAGRGECTRNPSYMNRNCKRSCNMCDGAVSDCRDMNENCPSWTRYCTNDIYREYLAANCMKSCNVCTSNDEVATTPTPAATTQAPSSKCQNMSSEDYCSRRQNRCRSSPSIRMRCAKTCMQCGP